MGFDIEEWRGSSAVLLWAESAAAGGGIGARLLDRAPMIIAEFFIFLKRSRPVLLVYYCASRALLAPVVVPEYFNVGSSFNVTPAFIY